MKKFKILTGVMLIATFTVFAESEHLKPIVAGYYRSGKKWEQTNPYKMIDCASYTHIYHIGSFPYDPATKKITIREPGYFPNPEMTKFFHGKKIKVMMCIGGGSKFFARTVMETPEDQEAYTTQLVDIVVNNGYDGIDINWEHPNNKWFGEKWDKLISILRKKLDEHGKVNNKHYLLSSSIPPGFWVLRFLNIDGIKKNLDFFNVMAYDYNLWTAGDHAKLLSTINSMKCWEQRGVPKDKIVMGVPFYSWLYLNSEINKKINYKKVNRTQIGYAGIKTDFVCKNNWDKFSDDSNIYCSKNKKDFAALEDAKVIFEKSEYFKKQGYRGVYCWSIACDDYREGSPLAKAMAEPWIKPKVDYSKRPIRVAGYVVDRDFNKNTAEFLIDDSVFDYLTDAILLTGSPKLDKITANARTSQIKEFQRRSGKKVIRWFSTAPSSNKAMVALMSSPEETAKNTEAIAQFLETNDFDGLNIDWEYPTSRQWKPYGKYLIELKKALKSKGKKLSLALAPWGVAFSKETIAAIDSVNIMSYDQMGAGDGNKHSTYLDAKHAINFFLKRNYPPEKLLLGLPFYGRHVKEKSLTHAKWLFNNGYEATYKNFITLFPNLPRFQNTIDGYYFNGIEMIKLKTKMAIDNNLAGVMIWEMGFDLPIADSRSLLRNIIETAPLAGSDRKALPKGKLISLPWPGGLSRDLWLKIPGSKISVLIGSPKYPDNPTYKSYIYNLQARSNWESTFGERIYGFLTPPVSGEYTFWISGSEDCELYLSIDDTQEGKKLIAKVEPTDEKYPASKEWKISPSQKSAVITLKAGQRYYIEVLHKENKSKDHLAVAWKIPGKEQAIITYENLSPYDVILKR